MPEDVKIAGKSLNRKWLYGAGAVAAGYVVFSWWRARNQDTVTAPSVDDLGVSTYTPPNVIPTTQDATGDFTPDQGTEVPTTNPQWVLIASQRLSDVGYDPMLVTATLSKYLFRRPLTNLEVEIVQAAIGVAGPPPVGGPYPIIPLPTDSAPSPSVPQLSTPSGLRALSITRTQVIWTWTRVSGAVSYRIRRAGQPDVINITGARRSGGLKPNTSYSWTVRAEAPGKLPSNWSSPLTVRTKR